MALAAYIGQEPLQPLAGNLDFLFGFKSALCVFWLNSNTRVLSGEKGRAEAGVPRSCLPENRSMDGACFWKPCVGLFGENK